MEIVKRILIKYDHDSANLIAILQDIQRELDWLPEDVLRAIAQRLGIPLTRIFAIASFYKAMSLKPKGRHKVNVCTGTACHVRGATAIMDELKTELGLEPGETTVDNRFTLETVRCVGCCGLAPVIMIDEDFHGRLERGEATKALKQYE